MMKQLNLEEKNIFTKNGLVTAICELLKNYSGDYDTFSLELDNVKVFDDESKAKKSY